MLRLILVAIAVTGCALPPTRNDDGPAQEQRQAIIKLIRSGQLGDSDEDNQIPLPQPLAAASRDGRVMVRRDPFMVFFLTWTGSSPDPYCGYEFAPETGSVDPDPLGSGHGEEVSL